VAYEVEQCIRVFSGQKQCQIQELNIQIDHVHVITTIPPKLSVSDDLGLVKGRTAIRVFKKFPKLKLRPYWGNYFWAPGYGLDTVGLDEEKTRRYVQYQERREKHEEQGKLFR
jgi:putative transposase